MHGYINNVNLPTHICWFDNPPQPVCCVCVLLHVELGRATFLLVSFLPADEWQLWDSPFCFPRHLCHSSHLSPFFFSLFSPGLSGGLGQMDSQGPFQHPGFRSALPLVLFLPPLSLWVPRGHLVSFMELSALEGGSQKKVFSLFYTKMMKSPQNNFTNSDLNTHFCLYFS